MLRFTRIQQLTKGSWGRSRNSWVIDGEEILMTLSTLTMVAVYGLGFVLLLAALLSTLLLIRSWRSLETWEQLMRRLVKVEAEQEAQAELVDTFSKRLATRTKREIAASQQTTPTASGSTGSTLPSEDPYDAVIREFNARQQRM